MTIPRPWIVRFFVLFSFTYFSKEVTYLCRFSVCLSVYVCGPDYWTSCGRSVAKFLCRVQASRGTQWIRFVDDLNPFFSISSIRYSFVVAERIQVLSYKNWFFYIRWRTAVLSVAASWAAADITLHIRSYIPHTCWPGAPCDNGTISRTVSPYRIDAPTHCLTYIVSTASCTLRSV